jgi:phospholipase/carboxylesterase
MPQFKLDGPSIDPLSGKTKQVVVFLHGYGADGYDLIGLSSSWRNQLPDAEFISPNAPFECDISPFGRQWFSLMGWDVNEYDERIRSKELLEGIRKAAPILNDFLDEVLKKRGLADENLALVGFSQGAMMALQVGLSRRSPCACIIGYSGGFIVDEKNIIKSKPPVLLIHGDLDEVIPFKALDDSKRELTKLGVPVQTQICKELSHGIDEMGLEAGGEFLEKHLVINSQIQRV